MKEYSSSWKSSGKPGKQRKFRANAPLHTKRRFVSAHLSKPLKEKHKKRAIMLRTGDTVKIMRGHYRGRAGKVESIDVKREEIRISGIETGKKDGTKALYPMHPSNLMITEMTLDDKRRLK